MIPRATENAVAGHM